MVRSFRGRALRRSRAARCRRWRPRAIPAAWILMTRWSGSGLSCWIGSISWPMRAMLLGQTVLMPGIARMRRPGYPRLRRIPQRTPGTRPPKKVGRIGRPVLVPGIARMRRPGCPRLRRIRQRTPGTRPLKKVGRIGQPVLVPGIGRMRRLGCPRLRRIRQRTPGTRPLKKVGRGVVSLGPAAR